jgi:hypothetical protein
LSIDLEQVPLVLAQTMASPSEEEQRQTAAAKHTKCQVKPAAKTAASKTAKHTQ